MIRFLRGQRIEQLGTAVILDVNGVGYEVLTPPRSVSVEQGMAF